jgi:DNA-binding NtrC family response regulator
MQQLLRMIDRVAKHNAAVLLVGETGVGKEVIAQTIHARSSRAQKALIDINCGALPDHLVESELFGYEKSAFSGADQMKQGLFELANGGTLFLDEIGELDIRLQSKLLRVLDGQPYFRLGGNRKVDVNVRLVAATNRDLKQEIERGRFRADLFHRIAQFQINVPALRERKEDIRAIADQLLTQQRPGARFTDAALDILITHAWPGNVRELKNVVLRAAVATENDVLDVCDLDLMLPNVMAAAAAASVSSSLPSNAVTPNPKENVKRLEDMERTAILSALQDCGGHQGKAAEKLGISRRTLTRKLKEYRDGQESTVIGVLSKEQQDYFRADLETQCLVTCAVGLIAGDLRNVSGTGAALRNLESLPAEKELVTLRFLLPDGGPVEAQCRVAWAENGEAGLQFTGATPPPLAAWLSTQQALEGWTPAFSRPAQHISQ